MKIYRERRGILQSQDDVKQICCGAASVRAINDMMRLPIAPNCWRAINSCLCVGVRVYVLQGSHEKTRYTFTLTHI